MPCDRTPSANAPTSSTPVGRMSRATSTRVVAGSDSWRKVANAAPMARHSSASSWSGTVPRTS